MKVRITRIVAILVLLYGSASLAQDQGAVSSGEPGVALPAVPATADPRRKPNTSPTSARVGGTVQTITVEPGFNEIIDIAVGHPNRIVTPFESPRVVTTASANVETSKNVLYVAPTNEAVITMFVTNKDDESTSISLTLRPLRIPPREIRLALPDRVRLERVRAQAQEQQDVGGGQGSYLTELRRVLRELASGRLPDGYTFSETAPSPHPPCDAPASFQVDFARGQYLIGPRFEVFVGVVRNQGSDEATFTESWCADSHVAAVALWPRSTLPAGAVTEIYVVQHLLAPVPDEGLQRPRLVEARS